MITRRVLLSLAAVAALVVSDVASRRAVANDQIAVQNFTLKNLEGRNVSLHESLAEGPVLVVFWATWCKPCLMELPKLSEMAEGWRQRGLSCYAITIDKPRSHGRVRSVVRSKKLDLDVLLDPNQEAFRALQGQTVPYALLLDETGDTAYSKVGYMPGDEKSLALAVEKLLGGEGLELDGATEDGAARTDDGQGSGS